MQLNLAFRSLCVAFLALVTLLPAHAAVWNYGTRLGLSSDWNDNPSLAVDSFDPDSTFRFLAAYDGQFARQDYNTNLTFSPSITRDYYPDSKFSNLESTNVFLPGSFNIERPTRVWSLGFNASQQSVLSSEETTSQGVNVGLLESDDTLTQFSLSPSLTWQVSERDELLFNLNYGVSDYDLDFTNRADSTTVGGNFSYRRNLNQRNIVGITTLFSSSDAERKARFPIFVLPITNPPVIDRIETGEASTDSTSSFITADYRYVVSTTSLLRISYGLQEATTETVNTLDSTGEIYNPSGTQLGELKFDSTTYNVEYSSEGARSTYSIAAIRTVTLDITSGQPQDRDEVRFVGDYRITDRLTGGWRLTAWQQEPITQVVLDENNSPINFRNEQKYTEAEARLDWQVTQKWYLNGRYQYRRRTNDQALGDRSFDSEATSNNIAIGISYLWKELPR